MFPVHLPPLRERPDDIAELVRHFVEVFARRLGRSYDPLPDATLTALQAYSWPGNVRELQHLIERAVILSAGRVVADGSAEAVIGDAPLLAAHDLELPAGFRLDAIERRGPAAPGAAPARGVSSHAWDTA